MVLTMDKKFLKLLEEISKRPAMFVGEVSISSISHFLAGYLIGRDDAKNRVMSVSWQAWIEFRFMICHPAWGWPRILLYKYGSDKEAISALPDLYKEFLKKCPSEPEKLEELRRIKFIEKYGADCYAPKDN